ncbi:MAG: efflux transporter outer membrane subunit [Duncaniella sp.]|nr:efflux transporter outer membrane subunit [Duncaniella sp.]
MKTFNHVLTIIAVALLSIGTLRAADTETEYLSQAMPQSWTYGEDITSVADGNTAWWKNFGDTLLDSLIDEGVNKNFNVSIAAHRMEIARQTLKEARSLYFPTFNFNGGWTKSRTSGAMTTVNSPASSSSYFSLGIDMSWQIDLFGKITAQTRDRDALFKASRVQYEGMMLSVSAEIATCYFNLRVLQAQKQVADEHLASQEKIVSITEVRYETGLASKLDVAQARALLYSTRATLPALDKAINNTVNAIALLIGVYPGEIAPRLEQPTALPDPAKLPVSVGVPMDLLRRRPDIAEAELSIVSYASRLGIAKKDYLPTLTLNGSIGTSAHDGKNLFKNNSLTYSIAPTLSWTIFDGLARNYAVSAAKEQLETAVDQYNLTVMTAVREADAAMCDFHYTLETMDLDKKVYDESAEAFSLSLDQYKSGLISLTPIVDAQLNMISYSNALIQQQGNALVALIDLYKALGGGWSSR